MVIADEPVGLMMLSYFVTSVVRVITVGCLVLGLVLAGATAAWSCAAMLVRRHSVCEGWCGRILP